jgi:cell division protein FtsI (penicillin-binding protein 3)
VGHVNAENRPLDGLELALDSILSGTAGSTALAHDVRGRSFESPAAPGVAARPGNTVVLTLNHQLQEIAERALDDATTRMSSDGGDVVIMDPHSGEVLAMASRRVNQSSSATAVTEPFEPGSTLKPFVVAGLLARGRANESDVIDTQDGTLTLENRVIHDEHKVGRASVAEVLQWSSNVGIVKLAQRLAAREQFEVLRDFGFGTATGIPYPSEANGVLRAPPQWSPQSPASLAMGYEISVTPLQLATAYAVFANGGELVEPALVKEVRAPDGSVRYRHTRRVVRRVISEDVAQRMRKMLLNVVENGTALQADLSSYLLARKTGTPRRTVNGRYAAQQYNPNFVGLFPGDQPQYVIVVKLTNPRDERGSFYGGSTAAPLTRAVLQAAIAARDAALDRNKLASSAGASGGGSRAAVTPAAAAGEVAMVEKDTPPPPYVVALPHPFPVRTPVTKVVRQVPDVRGLALRDAVRSLHSAGFQVRLIRSATTSDGETSPTAGTLAAPGTLVRLSYDF